MNPSHRLILRYSLLATLLLWGMYSLFQYLAIPVHQQVLLTGEQIESVAQACGSGSNWCIGFNTIFSFLGHTIGRIMQPLTWYIVLSLLVGAGFWIARYMKEGDWKLRFTLTPLHILGFSLLSLWVMFTVLSLGKVNDQPMRRLVEPTPQVYQGSSEQALAALQQNHQELLGKGCLTQVGMLSNGAKAYDMHVSCIQGSFFTRILPQLFFVLFILFTFLVLGRGMLSLLRFHTHHRFLEAVLSAGMGACGLLALLWTLAVASAYTQLAGWALLIGVLLLCYKQVLYWCKQLWETRWITEDRLYGLKTVLAWFLLSYLVLNFLNVVRPFPIGWDDLGRYMNVPRLLVSYGEHIPTLAAFYWEYITSLGFLLFGYDSTFATTASMMMNWLAGLLAVAVTFVFGNLYLGKGRGILAATIYYTLPMVGHFSFADMKIDNAVYATGALCMLACFLAVFPPREGEEADDEDASVSPEHYLHWKWMVIAGIFGGFAFAIKPTVIMVLTALACVLVGASLHWTAFIGLMLLFLAFFTRGDRLNIADISQRVYGTPDALSEPTVVLVLILLGIALLGYAFWRHHRRIRPVAIAASIFIVSFIASIAPWVIYNNISFGNPIPHLIFTSKNIYAPDFQISKDSINPKALNARPLPPELQIDPNHPACKGTARAEELDRYWGYRSGWTHYVGLPWRAVMNADTAGYYVTLVPALLLFPLLLLMPAFWRRRERWMRYLFAGTLFALFQWVFFGNGIIWYGLGVFLGLCIGLEFLVAKAPDKPTRITAGILLTISIFIALGNRFWQFEQQRNLFEYPMGKISGEAMRERTIPYYDDIREVAMQNFENNKERPYTFRIGTFIPYFIPKNLEVLPVADNQLSLFSCLNQGNDPETTTKRLKALGFSSIIFDTNTATIERDPNGTLHKKVNTFVDYANNPKSGVQIILSDGDAGLAYMLIP